MGELVFENCWSPGSTAREHKKFTHNGVVYHGHSRIGEGWWTNLISTTVYGTNIPMNFTSEFMQHLKNCLGFDRALTLIMVLGGKSTAEFGTVFHYADFRFPEDDRESLILWETVCSSLPFDPSGFIGRSHVARAFGL
jgi:hypothetical protein